MKDYAGNDIGGEGRSWQGVESMMYDEPPKPKEEEKP